MTDVDDGLPEPPPGTGFVSRTINHQGRVIEVGTDTVRFPDGSEGTLDLIKHAGASAIVPFLDPPESDDPRILLLRQYRYASGGYMYEVPAGMPAYPGEPWDACAHRELEEETGYKAGSLVPLIHLHTTPGFCDEVIRLWAAWDLSLGRTDHDDDEFLDVLPVRRSRILELIQSGAVTDAKSLVSLLFVSQFRSFST